jgi:hypothetical protein
MGVASWAATGITPGKHNAAANVASNATLRVTRIERPFLQLATFPQTGLSALSPDLSAISTTQESGDW